MDFGERFELFERWDWCESDCNIVLGSEFIRIAHEDLEIYSLL
jgi:hypothetical protein